MARRKPVSIATDGLYRKVGAIALGLALLAAMFGESSPESPTQASAAADAETHSSSPSAWRAPASGLADRDQPEAQDLNTEVAAVLVGRPSENDAEPAAEPAAQPTPGYSNPGAGVGPTQAQIRSVIEQSYRRSGNDGSGD